MTDLGIDHVTSSPYYPQSNGAAERAVQTAKKILSQDDPAAALMTYRCSKTVTGYSPNEVMLGADVRTSLPRRLTKPNVNTERILGNSLQTKMSAKRHYDQSALNQPLNQLTSGSPVRVRTNGEWSDQIYDLMGTAGTSRSYIVQNQQTGRRFRRNRHQLLPSQTAQSSDSSPSDLTAQCSPQPLTPSQLANPPLPIIDNPSLTVSDHKPQPVNHQVLPRRTTRSGRAVNPPRRYSP
ncbi:uncharacterized protein [Watersipora subatra]|uniref:uncharacterized protein n=1 Tax=Watersipora subatra TaxID=2589382 RepID=UPI00355C6B04